MDLLLYAMCADVTQATGVMVITVIFDNHLGFHWQISQVYKSCFTILAIRSLAVASRARQF